MSKRAAIEQFIDPSLMSWVEEQRAVNEAIRVRATDQAPIGSIEPALIRRRRLYNRDGSFRPVLGDDMTDKLVPTSEGDVLIRSGPDGTGGGLIVHFHGGGWSFGSVYEQDWLLRQLTRETGAAVCSVDYPLAPESQLPHAVAVAQAALAAILEIHPSRPVAIVGESAGAHVALSSVIAMTSEQRRRICAMSLTYGIYDLSMTGSQRTWGDDFLGLSTPWLEYFYSLTLPWLSREERGDAQHSPLNAELGELPPTLFSVGEFDPLIDDSIHMYERHRASGNEASLVVYPEAPHGFNHLKTRMAEVCNSAICDFLAARLDPGRAVGGQALQMPASR